MQLLNCCRRASSVLCAADKQKYSLYSTVLPLLYSFKEWCNRTL